MIAKIESIEDVKQFFAELVAEDLGFHPDTPFTEYVNIDTGVSTYTEREAELRDRLLTQAFDICNENEIDIYELAMEVFLSNNIL